MNRLCTALALRLGSLSFCIVLGVAGTGVRAQSAVAALRPIAQANRVAAQPDFGPQTQLSGHLPQWVSGGVQVASNKVDLAAPLHVSVVLRRDAAVQAAFTQFLADQQNPGSPLYHQWLTPQQVGELFGPTAADVAAVTSWLAAQGLTVDSVSPSRMILEVSGSTLAVGNAFRTSFAYFDLHGTARFSAVSEPSVPAALVPVIETIHGLTDVPVKPMSIRSAPRTIAAPAPASGPSPQLTLSSGAHVLTPNDFAVIYDINSVYSGGNKGATIGSKAQHVAIIGRSRVAATDISEYAADVGIASYNLNTIVPTTGVDPGVVCSLANAATCPTAEDQSEQTLDVDRVIGTAPGVQADLVVSATTVTANGIYIAAAYNVNTLLDPVMTISYGSCEYGNGSAGDNVWDAVFSAGAAEGISTFVSSGDSGANACATDGAATTATYPASMNAICASTYATCVGGTEFNDSANATTYWSSTNGVGLESALSYIPEGGWNEPLSGTTSEVAASGGGPSLYIGKPSWQTGTGVPADGHRDTPDVAYPSAAREGFLICLDFELGTSPYTCNGTGGATFSFFPYGGTSAAAPSMAAVTALLNTKVGVSQGNLNPLLYKLASSTSGSSVFHDASVATSGVASCSVAIPSMCNNSTPGPGSTFATVTGGEEGYLLNTGYDEVTGLGSIDVANFLTAAAAIAPTFTITPTSSSLSLLSGATSGNADTIAIASLNSFAGTVALTCTVTTTSGNAAGSCSVLPTSVVLNNNSSSTVLTIATTFGTAGTLSVTVTGTSGTTTVNSAAISVTVTGASLSLSAPAALSLTSGATAANTTTTTLSSVNAFSGTVALSCSISASSEVFPPTCAVSPASAVLTAGGSGVVTIAIGSTTAQARTGAPQQAGLSGWGLKGAALLCGLMLCMARVRSKRAFGSLAAFALLAAGLLAVSGCSSSSGSGSSGGGVTHGSSAGSYIVTVTATGTTGGGTVSTTATTSFSLTIH